MKIEGVHDPVSLGSSYRSTQHFVLRVEVPWPMEDHEQQYDPENPALIENRPGYLKNFLRSLLLP